MPVSVLADQHSPKQSGLHHHVPSNASDLRLEAGLSGRRIPSFALSTTQTPAPAFHNEVAAQLEPDEQVQDDIDASGRE